MKAAPTFALFYCTLLIPVLPPVSPAATPELKVLQVEFDNFVSERVTEVYNAELAKLNASYLTGVERALADAKGAGDLQSTLSLEDELKRIAGKNALPANDEQAAKSLKNLRGIYRQELVKLEARRDARLVPFLPPYLAKLKQLESDLTKANRVAEAKEVMEYRQEVSVSPLIKTATDITQFLKGTEWTWDDEKGSLNMTLRFYADKSCKIAHEPLNWSAIDATTVKLANGSEVRFSSNYKTFEATSPRGKRTGKLLTKQ